MSRRILHSRIGDDGTLKLDVPFGLPEAGREVSVTVESIEQCFNLLDWRKWILNSAGSWKGDFSRPEPGDFETREPLS